tara:strand:- start:595 stop:834 length:240 start_codon:yes stop_codon:yes gene_type:complete
MLKDANGNVLSKREEKMWIRFQKEFNRVKGLVQIQCSETYEAGKRVSKEIDSGQLSGKDRKFYNRFVGTVWDTKPLKTD